MSIFRVGGAKLGLSCDRVGIVVGSVAVGLTGGGTAMIREFFGRLRGKRAGVRRPNVVWICADDFAPGVSGAYGDPRARTPNLDRLGSEGLRFDRAYCPCPLSTPSRMAFLTGRHPRSVGVRLSPVPLPAGEVTIGGLLGRAGYETIGVGKTHFYRRLGGEFERLVDPPAREFDLSGPFEPRADGVRVLGPWLPFEDPAATWLNAEGLPFGPDSTMSGTILSGAAVDFLGERHRRPFFLWLGFYEVHSPFRFPIEFAGRFDPASFDPPEVADSERDLVPPVFRGLTPGEQRGIIASYHTSVHYMDRNVGRVLDALERSGHSGETLVVFNSDHGYLLGEHGRFEKHCCYEEAIRTALLMRLPGVIPPGGATRAMVGLVDVAATILELCGVEPPANLQGLSFAGLARGDSATHRDRIFVEYADNAEGMVRTDRWKLIHSAGNRRRRDGYALGPNPPGPSTRLYDLASDPGEHVDIAGLAENREVVEGLLVDLARHMLSTDPAPGAFREGDDARAILARTLPPGPEAAGRSGRLGVDRPRGLG